MDNDEKIKEYEAHKTPVPSYEEWQKLKEFADYSIHNRDELTRQINFWMQENTKLKEQINHLLKTQARQFVDNQKLQVKAEKAKDVVNIDTARQIKQLKELLKECRTYISRSATSRMIKNSAGYKKDMKLLTKIEEALK